jgi:hypothetical protein
MEGTDRKSIRNGRHEDQLLVTPLIPLSLRAGVVTISQQRRKDLRTSLLFAYDCACVAHQCAVLSVLINKCHFHAASTKNTRLLVTHLVPWTQDFEWQSRLWHPKTGKFSFKSYTHARVCVKSSVIILCSTELPFFPLEHGFHFLSG